jgi:hypothetical protein
MKKSNCGGCGEKIILIIQNWVSFFSRVAVASAEFRVYDPFFVFSGVKRPLSGCFPLFSGIDPVLS